MDSIKINSLNTRMVAHRRMGQGVGERPPLELILDCKA